MEQVTALLLKVLTLLIEAIEKIPASFWGVVFGAGLTLGGVLLSNRGNTKRLGTQLAHDRDVKKAEREFSTKRDIYFDAAEAISLALRSLPHFAYLHQTNDEIMKEYSSKSGALAKVQLIATKQTIESLSLFSIFLGKAILKLSVLRTPLLGQRGAILVEEAAVENAQKDFDNVMEAYKQYNFSGSFDERESARMQWNSKVTLDRVNSMRAELSKKKIQLHLKTMDVFQEAVRLHIEGTNMLPSLVEAIRAELDLPIDLGFLSNLQNQANLQMKAMSEELDAIAKAMAETT